MTSSMHWATPLIGKPWRPNASGPRAFYCWGLVRYVFHVKHGVDMPDMEIGSADDANVAAIKQASQVSGWRLAEAPPREWDIVLMRNKREQRHVGLMVQANGKLGVLHADGRLDDFGVPVGSVVWQSLADATSGGYHTFEFWRKE